MPPTKYAARNRIPGARSRRSFTTELYDPRPPSLQFAMAEWFSIHPLNPQKRLLDRVATRLRAGAVIVYPTDSCYALGCHLGDKAAAERLRSIRRFGRHHLFT